MNKKQLKNKLPNYILLPPVSLILNFFNFTSPNKLISFMKTTLNDKRFSNLDNKTINSILMEDTFSHKKTKKIVTDVLPNHQEIFEIFQRHTDTYSSDMPTYWENILKGLQHDFFKEEFPFSLMQISKVIKHERILLQLLENSKDLSSLLKNEWIQKIVTNDELDEFKGHIKSSDESGKFLLKIIFKTILYCIACIDAEISLPHKKSIDDKSRLYKLLPKFDSDEFVNPVESLFRYWKKGSGQSYVNMAQFISGKDEKTKEQKLRNWRQLKNIAKAHEIKKIAEGIFPQCRDDEYLLEQAVIGYYLAIFLSKLFEFMLYAKLYDRVEIFENDRELVEWIDTNYSQYINVASEEYLEFYDK